MVFKRFRPSDAYPILWIGLAVIIVMVLVVFYAAYTGSFSAGKASKILFGTLLIFVFGFAFGIGLLHKETVYPKVNYVDYHDNKVEFVFAMISHVVFIVFGLYIMARGIFPAHIPNIF